MNVDERRSVFGLKENERAFARDFSFGPKAHAYRRRRACLDFTEQYSAHYHFLVI